MFDWLIKFYKAWRLRRAQEEHAYWKAKRQYLEQHRTVSEFEKTFGKDYGDGSTQNIAAAAANEAKYMERVEAFLRDQ